MNRKTINAPSLLLGAVIALLAVTALGQVSERPPLPGRYAHINARDGVYILDTATGQMWMRNDRTVDDYGTPDTPDYRTYQVSDR